MKEAISAGGVVFRSNTSGPPSWLLIQHKLGHWGFPKGHVADKIENEPLEEAAVREVREEGGVDAEIIAKIPTSSTYIYEFNGEQVQKTVRYFLMKYLSGETTQHDHEVLQALFASEAEIFRLLTFETDKEIFRTALEIYKKIG